jgi:hypothetical protein
MDRPVHIDVAMINKITGLPTVGPQPIEYLDNKAREKYITKTTVCYQQREHGNCS